MENIGLGIELLAIGMIVVFVILYLVILLGKGLITISNKFLEEVKAAPAVKPATVQVQVNEKTKTVIEAVVNQLTGGKGHVSKITKL